MTPFERELFAAEMRYRREAKAILGACGVDLIWTNATEQAQAEAVIERMVSVVKRIERQGFVRGFAEATAALVEFLPDLGDPATIHDGLGCPRG